MKNTYFFYLFMLISLQIPLFSQNPNKSEGEINYRYYEDSLLAYPHPFRFIPAQRKPEPINMDEIMKLMEYPRKLVDIEVYELELTFKILVDEDGCYVKHMILKEANRLLIDEFEQYLPFIRYKAAMQNNKPIKFWLVIPFRFHLYNHN